MKEDFQKLRRQLDAYSQLAKEMTFVKNIGVSVDANDFNSDKKTFELVGFPDYVASDNIKRCVEHLLVAKAWTGKHLGYMGSENPYKNDGQRDTIEKIEPTADVVDITPWKTKNNWDNFNPIQKVDQLRILINQSLNFIQGYFQNPEDGIKLENSRSASIARDEIEVNLSEARFQLGFELQRMKEEPKQPYVDYNTPLYGGVKQK